MGLGAEWTCSLQNPIDEGCVEAALLPVGLPAGCLVKLRQEGEWPGVLSWYQGPRDWGVQLVTHLFVCSVLSQMVCVCVRDPSIFKESIRKINTSTQ